MKIGVLRDDLARVEGDIIQIETVRVSIPKFLFSGNDERGKMVS